MKRRFDTDYVPLAGDIQNTKEKIRNLRIDEQNGNLSYSAAVELVDSTHYWLRTSPERVVMKAEIGQFQDEFELVKGDIVTVVCSRKPGSLVSFHVLCDASHMATKITLLYVLTIIKALK